MPSTATSMLDGLSASVAVKAPCRAVATSNITLSGLQTVGGVVLVEDDRVLVTSQTSGVDNGIYIASSGSWTRAPDADGNRDLRTGTLVIIESDGDGVYYQLTTANPIVIDTTALVFEARDIDDALRGDLASTTAGSDGAREVGYRRNAAGSIAESSYGALSRDIEATSFGFATGASASTNAAAIVAALVEAGATGAEGGGTVHLPAGTFNCNPFEIGALRKVRGRGYGTQLLFASSGHNIKVGGEISGALKHKCGISDISFILTHKDGHGIRLMETAGAEVARILGEGTLTALRSNRFLTIDGGNISSFFNRISDCYANHIHNGYTLETTGTTETTQSFFDNCNVLGDVASFPTSIGLVVRANQGSGMYWAGGNFESMGKGVVAESTCKGFTVAAARFEGNTVDTEASASAGPHTYYGCMLDPGKIVNTGSRAAHIHCHNGTDTWIEHLFPGVAVHRAQVTGETPLIIEGFPGDTTTETLLLRNSASQKLFSVTNQGKIARINNAAPVAVNAACTDLPTAVALLNQIRANLIAIGINA